jgi:hypothetical protein
MDTVRLADLGLPGDVGFFHESDPYGSALGQGDIDPDPFGIDADFSAKRVGRKRKLGFPENVMCGHGCRDLKQGCVVTKTYALVTKKKAT